MSLADWEPHAGYFTTRNIKEAVRFRKAADSKAERIFKTLMLRNVPIPSGGFPTPKGLELLDFQSERGVPYILGRNRSYLAHSPGLGKSAQAIAAVSTKPGRTLIICPSFLKINWAREITKWFYKDFPRIQIVYDKDAPLVGDFLIVSDAMIEKEWVREKLLRERFKFKYIDEEHRFKTPWSNRAVALYGGKNKKIESKGLVYDADHVCGLSGTPMLNRPIELWTSLYARAPEVIDFMSYQEFGFRYCGATQTEYGWEFLGSSREDELKSRLGRFMQRIKKEDVLPDLPEKIREVIAIDRDPRRRDVIRFDHELLSRFKKEGKKVLELGEYAELRHANGLAKVDWASKFIADIMNEDEDEQIILFAHHRDVVSKLAFKLSNFKPEVINGGVREDERTRIEDAFQSGRCKLVIGNIDAMNLGLTLTKATRVIFVEYSWTPALNEQAEDRANRIGSLWSVFCQYIVLPGSIDEDILTSNVIKQQRIERVGA
jgi:SWI/SNF-related matrix-associated actin-dependent regulator 1 of chromatin subfamily A